MTKQTSLEEFEGWFESRFQRSKPERSSAELASELTELVRKMNELVVKRNELEQQLRHAITYEGVRMGAMVAWESSRVYTADRVDAVHAAGRGDDMNGGSGELIAAEVVRDQK